MTNPNEQHSPTIEGAILGTAAYMSPEQARGRRVDKRTDIWAFGVLLYEMMVGISPFQGETASDSIGAVLHKHLDLDKLPQGTPGSVRRVLDRCLQRDKNLRYRDIGDVRIELLRYTELDSTQMDTIPTGGGVKRTTAVMLVIFFAMFTGGTAWLIDRLASPTPERTVRKFEVLVFSSDEDFMPASVRLSPDGMRIAYIHEQKIKVRDLSTFGVRTLADVEDASLLAWSPDGLQLAYMSRGGFFRLSATGGGETKIAADTSDYAFVWNDSNQLLFSVAQQADALGINQVPVLGGNPEIRLGVDVNETLHFHSVANIPGTDVIMFVRHRYDQRTPIEAWDGKRSVVVTDFDDHYTSDLAWSPSGHILFTRGLVEVDLWAVPFSTEKMMVTGTPFLVQSDAMSPSVSADGSLTFVRGSFGTGTELIWILPDGSTETIAGSEAFTQAPVISPDGRKLAYSSGTTPNDMQVWVRDLDRGISSRISSLEGFVFPIAWSSDGKEVAVLHFDPSAQDFAQKTHFVSADGAGLTREPYIGLLVALNQDWSMGIEVTDPRAGDVRLKAIDMRDRTLINEITSSPGGFVWNALNPEGDLLLYTSDVSGKSEIYCITVPGGETRWQVSDNGGDQAFWAPDGSAAYYLDRDRELIRVDLTRDPDIRFGRPVKNFVNTPEISSFTTVQPDPMGERFVSVRPMEGETEQAGFQIMMIDNWFEEFRESEQ